MNSLESNWTAHIPCIYGWKKEYSIDKYSIAHAILGKENCLNMLNSINLNQQTVDKFIKVFEYFTTFCDCAITQQKDSEFHPLSFHQFINFIPPRPCRGAYPEEREMHVGTGRLSAVFRLCLVGSKGIGHSKHDKCFGERKCQLWTSRKTGDDNCEDRGCLWGMLVRGWFV